MKQQEKKLFKIGDFAKEAGVTVRTIRYYEELGLIIPSQTSPGGFRLYSQEDLGKLLFIKRFKELEFPLEEIKHFFDQTEIGETKNQNIAATFSLLQRQLEQVNSKITELQYVKKDIAKAIVLLEECEKCTAEECPQICINKRVMLRK